MSTRTFIEKLIRGWHRFRAAERGNVVVTFALATIPMVGFVGAAVDYSHANSIKAALQASLDATALAMSKTAGTLSAPDLQTKSEAYFKALFTRPEATGVTVTATYNTTEGSSLTITGSAMMTTNFMKVLGFRQLAVNSTATASWGNNRLRVALVLDNTGSMADAGKITALISATKNLLTTLQNAVTNPGDVYVSIVPFVKDVNLNATNYNSNWIYWGNSAQDPSQSDQNSWDANNGTCSPSSASTRSACTAKGTCSISGKSSKSSCNSASACSISGYSSQSTCTGAGVCSKSQYTSQNSCNNHSGTWTAGVWAAGVWTPATWTANNHSTWNGCSADRGNSTGPNSGNYDANVAAPTTTNSATLYPAEQYSPCPQQVMALNYDWSAMATLVNAMSPGGNTNQALGLQLGWMSLVGGGPFPTPPALDSRYKYIQAIILLTDGLNTQDRWYTDQTSIDNRQAITCSNIKAAGITLYTVQVNTGGDPTSTLLQNCASDSSKFFLLTSANQILTTFNQIGTALSQLRIAK